MMFKNVVINIDNYAQQLSIKVFQVTEVEVSMFKFFQMSTVDFQLSTVNCLLYSSSKKVYLLAMKTFEINPKFHFFFNENWFGGAETLELYESFVDPRFLWFFCILVSHMYIITNHKNKKSTETINLMELNKTKRNKKNQNKIRENLWTKSVGSIFNLFCLQNTKTIK